jgi:hypothetical protein
VSAGSQWNLMKITQFVALPHVMIGSKSFFLATTALIMQMGGGGGWLEEFFPTLGQKWHLWGLLSRNVLEIEGQVENKTFSQNCVLWYISSQNSMVTHQGNKFDFKV